MASIKTVVFRRIVEPTDSEVQEAITAVVQEVNDFLAGLPNLGDALDVRYDTRPITKYGSRLLYSGTVIYVEV